MLELIPFISNNRVSNYDPFKDMENFEKHFFGTDRISSFKTDIKDNGNEYLLEADLPGFKKEDIDVNLENNYLTIKAERKVENEEKDKKGRYIRCERSYGSFVRSFDVSDVDTDKITASYEDGVLKLNMPKKENALHTAKKLEIK
ncbi:MAG: Hsp20/alpha crystallin family protein [Eubacteriales bacterium]|nr:Hsp20/alpha crystallin family protein [Eubacterium sp.]MDD7180112.1 Hsp20/alpha crystallin family protein [Eubacterium sp.]MDY5493027.1 Hsp20/alpha crystallin family protein [Eubacteriales bacterium]CDE17774.1 heat shock protein Hsp20 [Eubacterium sp. CAG:841]